MNKREPTQQVRMNMELFGRRTSFALEAGVWDALTEMCREREQSVDEVCEAVVRDVEPGVSMASTIRMAVLQHFMDRAA